MDKGILTGCDANQEWLLPWWYANFRKSNADLPIAFADLGMSNEAREWCKQRGELIDLPENPTTTPSKEGVPFLGEQWSQVWSKEDFPTSKPVWFIKAIMLAHTPFYRTLWLDLDCEVRGDITPLLSSPLTAVKLKMKKTATKIVVKKASSDELFVITIYNSGVVLYEKDSYLLHLWSEAGKVAGSFFWGDDFLASLFIAHLKNEKITIPLKYNWDATRWGLNPDAIIHHWQEEKGKNIIKLNMMLENH